MDKKEANLYCAKQMMVYKNECMFLKRNKNCFKNGKIEQGLDRLVTSRNYQFNCYKSNMKT